MDTVVTPSAGTVVTDSDRGNCYKHGLEGKDAAFLSQLHSSDSFRDITSNIERSGRDTDRANADARLTTALASKDIALHFSKENAELKLMISEAAAVAKAEGQATRDLLNAQETQRLRDQLNDNKQETLILKLKIGGISVPV